jgi:TonB-linked SusC/RagA family outer membrane protein
VLAFTALTVLLGAGTAFAQASRVEGTVRNAQSRDPIANARVSVVGTDLFATTNENGYYAVENVPVGTYDVRVQVIGFQSVVFTNQRVAAGIPTTVNYQLQPSILRIEGVVVTGVAEQTQAIKLPFTVAQVGSEELPVPMQSAEEAIRGKVAGVRIVKGEGTPGSGANVVLRGATSISSAGRSNEPLYVVDGVILAGSAVGDMGDPNAARRSSMVDIDALDIESIEVVKGAAAAALYGARAANGVVSITTRRGSEIPDGETSIILRGEYGQNGIENYIPQSQSHWFITEGGQWMGTVPRLAGHPDCIALGFAPDEPCSVDSLVGANERAFASRTTEWRPSVDEVDAVDGGSYIISDNAFPGVTYDNLDRFYAPGSFYTNSVSVSHRTGSTNFRASAHTTRETGVVEGVDGYIRRGARVNVDHRIGRTFDFSASGYYSQSNSDDPQGGENAFYSLNFYPIDVDLLELYPEEERRDSNDFLIDPDPLVVESNPIYSSRTRNNDEEHTRGRVLGSFGLRWRPTDVFDIKWDMSFDRSDRNDTWYFFKGFRTVDPDPINSGQLTKQNAYDQAINTSLDLTFVKRFGDLATNTKIRGLLERQEGEWFWGRGNDLRVGEVKDQDMSDTEKSYVESGTSEIRSIGYFLSTQLDYKDRYIIDALVRRDGSSLFGEENRWKFYYRAGLAYRLSEESFWNFGFWDELKLRASIGTAGGRPGFLAQYETYEVAGGNVTKGNLGNTQLLPEHATEIELGADMIFGGKMSIGVTYADNKVEDQILLVPLAGYYGFSNQWRNAGTLEGNTWEGSLQWAVLQQQNVTWTLNFVIDRTRQQITEFDLPAYREDMGSGYDVFYMREGEKLGTMYGNRWATTCGELIGYFADPSQYCSEFAMNSDGYLVAVGSNGVGEGISGNLWGSSVTIGGETFNWGMPIKGFGVDTSDVAGTAVIDTVDYVRIGNTQPDFNYGIGSSFRYKGFTIYALFDGQSGGQIYNGTRQWSHRDGNSWEVDQGAKPDAEKKPLVYWQTLYNVNDNNSHFVESGTFTKFRELSLTYTFNRSQLEGFLGGVFNRLSFSLIGRNLVTWTDYTGYDPEVANNDTGAIYRVDDFDYPNYRTFTGSIEIEF